ncbi:hypothetical protein PCANC_18678 [Puccinia coronata f. sp. avenae]|uniref:Hydrophobin n=1 Tax=Puccinia coronata f. sp. avenae TaxID=200324 RepID=A0A2N5VC88_9BASI|nr:hypothetical protein PCASD_15313 [Puccinia coronata f. sp. avenae]PLW47617.1 hypothetical protein PCANC_18678 [Puccinia coronata f. sp. avenae]
MQLLPSLIALVATAAGLISAQDATGSADIGFKCNHQYATAGQTSPFCAVPGQDSFSYFAPASPVGRSPPDHYECPNAPNPAEASHYCCTPNTINPPYYKTPRSKQQVKDYCAQVPKTKSTNEYSDAGDVAR